MSMSCFPWQQSQWQRLQAARQQGRLPHALLLTGPQGLGKAEFARLFAQSLLCDAPLQEGVPCGHCRYCQLFQAGSHPDIQYVTPPEGKKVISVDQIREIGRFVTLKSQYAGHKVVIIEPAEAMNINASNSLLKTLEEPSAETLLLLVTHQPAQLPATIRSRCQEVRFGIDADAGRAWLAQQLPAGADLELLLALADAAPLKALQLAEEGLPEQRGALLEGVEQLSAGSLDPVALAAQCIKQGPEWSLDCLYSWTADMIRMKSAGAQPPHSANPDLQDRLHKLADQVSLTGLFLLQDRVREAQRALERNLNPTLALESLLIRWQRTFRPNNKKIA
jgi:DNA polymerase-3 subunit delta'